MNTDRFSVIHDAFRQAERDYAWMMDEDEDEFDEHPLLVLDRKHLKRDAWHKASRYARETRSRYATSYERAYKRHRARRIRRAS